MNAGTSSDRPLTRTAILLPTSPTRTSSRATGWRTSSRVTGSSSPAGRQRATTSGGASRFRSAQLGKRAGVALEEGYSGRIGIGRSELGLGARQLVDECHRRRVDEVRDRQDAGDE